MEEEIITLWRYRDLPEALIAKSKLDSEDLQCFLADENVVRLDWFWSNAVGGVRLQVANSDAESAFTLLAEEIPASFSADEIGEEYRQPECLHCGSLDVTFGANKKNVALVLLGVLQVPILLPVVLALLLLVKQSWQCEDCGYDWEAEDDS